MARFVGPFKFSGNVGGYRGYWDKDLQEWIVATKKQKNPIHNKHAPRALENNDEFTGVVMWSKLIRRMTDEVVYLKKGRRVGELNAIGKKIQLMDRTGDRGKRQIESSKYNFPLIGFSFNKEYPFSSVFTGVPELSITEDRREVTLKLNDFISKSKFNWPETVGYFRVFLEIFELPDLAWDEESKAYNPYYFTMPKGKAVTVSDWISVITDPIDFQQSVAFKEGELPREKSAVVVVMGLEFASGMDWGTPYVVKDHGTAAIVACF